MSALVRVQVRKELRELLPWWTGIVVAVLSCAGLSRLTTTMPGSSRFQWLFTGVLVYGAGAIALGGLSIGHEYTHRTLGALLAQPIDRRRVLITKLAVLAPMVALLTVVMLYALSRPDYPLPTWQTDATLAMLIALFVAPWLTMVCRGPLAGTVFAIAIPVLLLSVDRATRPEFSEWHLVWRGTELLAALGAFMTWRMFLKLEAIDGPQAEIDAPAWLRGHTVAADMTGRARGRIWQIVLKELQLQQMTFVISGFYVAVWVAVVLARRWLGPGGPDLQTIALFHGGLVAVMAGALPSGEERQLGTADWQLLLPMPAWKQWAIKAGLAISMAVGLALGLPALLARIQPGTEHLSFENVFAYGAVLLCIAALYISSLSSSGMRALLASLPGIAGATLLGSALLRPIMRAGEYVFQPIAAAISPSVDFLSYSWILNAMPFAAGFALLLLGFGYANHRWADRSVARTRRQVMWIAGYVLAWSLVYAFVMALFTAALAQRYPRA